MHEQTVAESYKMRSTRHSQRRDRSVSVLLLTVRAENTTRVWRDGSVDKVLAV